ncbi:MAG: dihydroorotate dehydrogenase electron transfer subunit [Oscillospiraceae bacterium]|nr:dihydroorotate dehydrogenase electron transfer subunit [Oscillospiraceae bacterium]
MYKKGIYTIGENTKIAKDVYLMTLYGDTSFITAPGQFINIQLDGFFLRRPISICDWDKEKIVIIYKVVGAGTEAMAKMTNGQTLDVLTGLGNGFTINADSETPLVIGGGVGTPPMYNLAKQLIAQGKKPTVILGFTSADDVFYEKEFAALGCDVYVTTNDGSYGTKGFVTDVIKNLSGFDYFYTCGPEPMLKAIAGATECSGQLSFEERMGCGFGGCMGCSCKTLTGNKRICKEGPILVKEEIIW